MPPLLYLFALANLVIGTGAFVLSGILSPLAQSLGVSVAVAGQAMTAYALAAGRASGRCCCRSDCSRPAAC